MAITLRSLFVRLTIFVGLAAIVSERAVASALHLAH